MTGGLRKRFRRGRILMHMFGILSCALCLGVAGCTGSTDELREVAGFGENPGDLQMFEYVPSNLPRPAPLVVVLHGCAQDAAQYLEYSGWRQLADRWGLVLLLPQQKRWNNFNNCFNWFEPEDAGAVGGEAESIRQMIARSTATREIDSKRIFVTGLSAGGAMTAVLLADFPDVFSGGAIVAGIPFKCATGLFEGLGCMFSGQDLSPEQWAMRVRSASAHRGPWPRVSVWQGVDDPFVSPVNARELVEQWAALHGIDPKSGIEEMMGAHTHVTFRQGTSARAAVELYRIADMGHGVPVDPGDSPPHCGRSSTFFPDKAICASYWIGAFWGLEPG